MSAAAATADVADAELTRAFIRARLAAARGRPRGDVTTAAQLQAAGAARTIENAQFPALAPVRDPDAPRTPAAVLVALVEYQEGFSVILTQRTADLKAHGGQISFPGGRAEPGDADADATALREAEEEVGLHRPQVEILGRLDTYTTVTGYDIIPVVGAITPPIALTPDPAEVAEIFEVPLAFFLDPANHQRHARSDAAGAVRAYYAMPYRDRYIWGATAGMLINLYDVLTAPAA